MKAYLAGPDVFRPDAGQWAEAARALCLEYAIEALIPLDGDATDAAGIYIQNVAMIEAADVVLANLRPFRGVEPDSGTSFEMGYAAALGKPIVAYLPSLAPQVQRLLGVPEAPLQFVQGRWVDAEGLTVEDFDLPVNLMLAVPACLVEGGLCEALEALHSLTGAD